MKRSIFRWLQLYVISLSVVVVTLQYIIGICIDDINFNDRRTNIPSVTIILLYLLFSLFSVLYVRCCYQFFFVGEERITMILFLVVFVLLWLFPVLYYMIPKDVRRQSEIEFLKNICMNLNGLATCFIWRCCSSFKFIIWDDNELQIGSKTSRNYATNAYTFKHSTKSNEYHERDPSYSIHAGSYGSYSSYPYYITTPYIKNTS